MLYGAFAGVVLEKSDKTNTICVIVYTHSVYYKKRLAKSEKCGIL